ncbi:hypothetical protein JIQ42_03560 [Leishmania sp. Namibia]|uniref:hypothetical protein n=1 Tax=Leishmania sp. Namibia TaxID=2802991 RepID=UPI001B55BF42|nr:hypothetical protein JIQ42_03560 [Leishmania sp. Namibia]
MLPPTHVYSTVIHNSTAKEVTVIVTYSNMINNTSEHHSITVTAGGKGVAEPRTYMENGVTFAIVITEVNINGSNTTLTAPFPGVDSPTNDYPIKILEDSGEVHLRGGEA